MPRESNGDGEQETGEAAKAAASIDGDGLGNLPGHANSVDDDRPTVSNSGTGTGGRVDGAGLVDPEKALTNGEEAERDARAVVRPGNRGDELGNVDTGAGIDKELRTRGAEGGGGEAEEVGGEEAVKAGANPDAELKAKPEMPAEKNAADPVGKPLGNLVGKPQAQQVTGISARTEWFRPELDFRKMKSGYAVLIRKRLRWSDERYSHTILKRNCPQLTRKMVEQIRSGKFTDAAVAALVQGGIGHGFIRQLIVRIGKGNGRRRTDLTDNERSLLARIERSLAASRRREDDRTRGNDATNVQVSREHLQDSSDDDAPGVPYVH